MPDLVGSGRGVGSNSWVVDGEHSATGMPLLANDPHLGISQPGIWMQMGLHCRELSAECTLDTSGFTFSGVPGVIIGHNADIAWGFTNLGPDVTDLFLEQTEGDDRYVRDGESVPMQVRTETIGVRGADDVELRVRETVHGPLISDVSSEFATVGANAPTDEPGERGSGYAVALAWTALDPAPTADAILELNRASDWDEFRAAAADFAVPAQNLVYADREGHIGYQSPGRIPIRRSGNDGTMPVEGWISANDWTGDYVPFDGLPSVLDPDEGFIVTANQAVIGQDYPYLLTEDWDYGYRSTRIRELLTAEGELSVQEMASLQLDSANPMAGMLVPYLLDIEDLPGRYYRNAQDLFRGWDLSSPADSAPAAYVNVVWRNLLELTFHDDLDERSWPDGGDRWFRVVGAMLPEPAGPWWDDVDTEDVVETRDDILRAAMIAGPRRAHPAPGARPAPLDLGPPAPDEPPQRDPRRVRHRADRAALQPRRLGGGRRVVDRRRHVVERRRRLRGHRRALHADGGLARRLRRLALDQPHRRLRPPRVVALLRPDRALRRGPDPALGVLPRRRRGGRRRPAGAPAGRVGTRRGLGPCSFG